MTLLTILLFYGCTDRIDRRLQEIYRTVSSASNVEYISNLILTSVLNADSLSPDPGIFLYPDPRFPESEPETGLKNAIYFFVNS
jgi:hypothetical protein